MWYGNWKEKKLRKIKRKGKETLRQLSRSVPTHDTRQEAFKEAFHYQAKIFKYYKNEN